MHGTVAAAEILLGQLLTYHIQCGHTHDLPLVIHSHPLQGLGSNGHSAVHRVGDDVQEGLQWQDMMSF